MKAIEDDWPEGDYLQNFAMLMPNGFLMPYMGGEIFIQTLEESEEFKKWFEGQSFHQLSLGETKIDRWMRNNDLVIDRYPMSIYDWHKEWKKNIRNKPPFEVTTFNCKPKA